MTSLVSPSTCIPDLVNPMLMSELSLTATSIKFLEKMFWKCWTCIQSLQIPSGIIWKSPSTSEMWVSWESTIKEENLLWLCEPNLAFIFKDRIRFFFEGFRNINRWCVFWWVWYTSCQNGTKVLMENIGVYFRQTWFQALQAVMTPPMEDLTNYGDGSYHFEDAQKKVICSLWIVFHTLIYLCNLFQSLGHLQYVLQFYKPIHGRKGNTLLSMCFLQTLPQLF